MRPPRGAGPAELRAGIFGGENYSRLMPDWPTETITDQDLRYRELLAQKAEARVRFLASDQARDEIRRAAAGRKAITSWKPVSRHPLQNCHRPAIPWKRSP